MNSSLASKSSQSKYEVLKLEKSRVLKQTVYWNSRGKLLIMQSWQSCKKIWERQQKLADSKKPNNVSDSPAHFEQCTLTRKRHLLFSLKYDVQGGPQIKHQKQ